MSGTLLVVGNLHRLNLYALVVCSHLIRLVADYIHWESGPADLIDPADLIGLDLQVTYFPEDIPLEGTCYFEDRHFLEDKRYLEDRCYLEGKRSLEDNHLEDNHPENSHLDGVHSLQAPVVEP